MKHLFPSVLLFCCSVAGLQAQPGVKSNQVNRISSSINKSANLSRSVVNSIALVGSSTNRFNDEPETNSTDSNATNASVGRVGIKTTAPLADLHVAGTVKIAGTTTLDNLAGSGGYRMVVVDSNGVLSTMPMPSIVDTNGVGRYSINMRPSGYMTPAQVTQELYVSSSTGNDNNSGTQNSPFQTLSKLNSLSLTPGTRIWLKGGDIFYGTLNLNGTGTQSKPIEICSSGDKKAIINAGNNDAIIVENRNWIIIHDLDLMGSGRKTGNTKNGLLMNLCNNSLVKDIVSSGFQKSGVSFESCNNMTMEYVYAHTNGFAGIFVGGEYMNPSNTDVSTPGNRTSNNNIIRYCIAENNAGDPTVSDNHSGNGILIGSSDKCLIEYCVATNNGYDMPRGGNGPVGIWGYEVDSLIIRKCISYKNKTSPNGQDGGGFDLDGGCTNCIIEYCLSYENEGSGYGVFQYWGAGLFSNNIIRYCVSIEDARKNGAGIFTWRDQSSANFKDFYMHNCLIYNSTKPALRFDVSIGLSNFNFNNNVFIGNGDIVTGNYKGEKFLGNVWWNMQGNPITFRGYNSLTAWSNATNQEKDSSGVLKGMQVNPNIIGPYTTTLTDPKKLQTLYQYKPMTGSPLLGNGLPASALGVPLPTSDFYGNSITPTSLSIALMRN